MTTMEAIALIREHLKTGKTKEEIAEMFLDAEIDGGKPHDIDVVYDLIAEAEKTEAPEEAKLEAPPAKPAAPEEAKLEAPPAKPAAPETRGRKPAAKPAAPEAPPAEAKPEIVIPAQAAEPEMPVYEKWKVNARDEVENGKTVRRIDKVGEPIKEVRISDQLADMLNRSGNAGNGIKFMYFKK